jgi:ribosome-associated heat shock protein Hsp15
MENETRVDKWLWAVRIFKTRSQASDACHKGYVFSGNLPVKASHLVRTGEIIGVRKPPIIRTYHVLGISGKRVSALLAERLVKDITPPEQLEILERQKDMRWIGREKGTGRPTKKERRELDGFMDY